VPDGRAVCFGEPADATSRRLLAGEDIRKLDNGVHVVSGTPGRVFDMIQRRNLRTRHIKTLILDEADEMLAKNFKDQIYDIYRWARLALLACCFMGRACSRLSLIPEPPYAGTSHPRPRWCWCRRRCRLRCWR
jgi:hypothetical protein